MVFGDEKPMKELMIFAKTRRDIKSKLPSTAKNSYNILCTVNLKGGDVPPIFYKIIDETTDSSIFIEYVKILIENVLL